MNVLEAKELVKIYGKNEAAVTALKGVNLAVEKSEFVAIVGTSGSGKSTFLNIITGKLMPDEGKVIWSNRVRVGYMDQHAELEKGLTIREVLRSAFKYLFDMEAEMNELYGRMGEMDEDEMILPFRSLKQNGMGIGLYYTSLVMEIVGGKLLFPATDSLDLPPVYNGACVALVFSNSNKNKKV